LSVIKLEFKYFNISVLITDKIKSKITNKLAFYNEFAEEDYIHTFSQNGIDDEDKK
jgi:hypothetical protein